MRLHVHLDAIGGAAGDMFAAAMLDARPDLAEPVREAVAAISGADNLTAEASEHGDGILCGAQFKVQCPAPPPSTAASELRARMAEADLVAGVQTRAIAMLDLLAEAEAKVHGIPAETVKFHELGGLDTLVDLVAAAAIIDALGEPTWSCGALPSGQGTVKTAHGILPVPAPATIVLLEGMVLVDDGLAGERITPTGAAILRNLAPSQEADFVPRRLVATGHGFGTSKMKGRSNVLRSQVFEPVTRVASMVEADQVAVIEFEIDDQSPEDLAVGLDRLRANADVLDVVQYGVIGKKGRQAAHIRILANPDGVEAVTSLCFAETTTIGLRWSLMDRKILVRDSAATDGDQGTVRVKMVTRPDGSRTAKAEMSDVQGVDGHAGRSKARRRAEAEALDEDGNDGDDG